MSTRREFLQSTGALTICFALPACVNGESDSRTGALIAGNRLRVGGNGTIDLMLGKVELGQGIGTALAQFAAEELDVALERVRISTVDTDYSPDESYTFSSISIQQSGPPTRKAAAAARANLLRRAAAQIDAPVSELTVIDGVIHRNGAASGVDYWNLLGDEEMLLELPEEQTLKSPQDFSIVGTSAERIDLPGKVFGDASFIQDLRLPEMVHARIVRPPAERASIASFDADSTEALPGVLKVVRDGNFVGVIAERESQARAAAAELSKSTKWDLPADMPDERRIYGWLKNAESRSELILQKSTPTFAAVETEAVTSTYQRPYMAHASISPSAAIAHFDGENMLLYSHAQGMYPLRSAVAHVLGLSPDKLRCVHVEASGCYGHNGGDDASLDAAALAMHFPGKPVRLQWERADEMSWEPYGSAMHIEIDAAIDSAGDVHSWNYRLWSCPHSSRPRSPETAGNMIYALHKEDPLDLPPAQSIPQPNGGADRNALPLYEFPNVQVQKNLVTDVPIRVSALRGLGAYANVFAIESFMDELAVRAGRDPFEYRLKHLEDERAIALLLQLRDSSGWENRPAAGTGEGWGLGFARFKNRSSWVGVVMRLKLSDSGDISLQKASAVCDAGLIVNPDGTRAQIEGSIVQSASWTLKEQVHFSESEKTSTDWSSYPILRFDEVPDIEVELMARDDMPALGVGESAQGPTAAAIGNALFHATGHRARRLPLN
ncbi:MAG: molybdopterin cofactor-binding domain-containing protein [Woeseiaceae bacterium]